MQRGQSALNPPLLVLLYPFPPPISHAPSDTSPNQSPRFYNLVPLLFPPRQPLHSHITSIPPSHPLPSTPPRPTSFFLQSSFSAPSLPFHRTFRQKLNHLSALSAPLTHSLPSSSDSRPPRLSTSSALFPSTFPISPLLNYPLSISGLAPLLHPHTTTYVHIS